MRQIKFRAWDGKEMYSSAGAERNGPVIKCEPLMSLNDLFKVLPDAYTLMQFTGLLDKNGTEIYEGDIVSADTEISRAVVEWKDGSWVRRWLSIDGGESFAIPLVDVLYLFKIIGNIYENPNLL